MIIYVNTRSPTPLNIGVLLNILSVMFVVNDLGFKNQTMKAINPPWSERNSRRLNLKETH